MSWQVDLNDIRLLMQVIEHGSYTAASRASSVPKSTISQRIAALERAAGTGLLRRTSRSFSVTEAGAKLLPHARAIEDLAQQIEHALLDRGQELRGTLRVACSTALAQSAISSLIPKFLAAHRQVTVHFEATNRLVDIVSEGFDMTIRCHRGLLKDSSLVQRVLARVPWVMVAAPAWLEAHGYPTTPDDIPADEVLSFETISERQLWVLRRDDVMREVTIGPRLISDDVATLRASALAAGGITCLPSYVLRDDIARGQLVPVLPDWSPPVSTISVLTPPKSQSSRLARTFSEFLALESPRAMRGD